MYRILFIIGLYLHEELYCSFFGREFVDHTIQIYFMRGKWEIFLLLWNESFVIIRALLTLCTLCIGHIRV